MTVAEIIITIAAVCAILVTVFVMVTFLEDRRRKRRKESKRRAQNVLAGGRGPATGEEDSEETEAYGEEELWGEREPYGEEELYGEELYGEEELQGETELYEDENLYEENGVTGRGSLNEEENGLSWEILNEEEDEADWEALDGRQNKAEKKSRTEGKRRAKKKRRNQRKGQTGEKRAKGESQREEKAQAEENTRTEGNGQTEDKTRDERKNQTEEKTWTEGKSQIEDKTQAEGKSQTKEKSRVKGKDRPEEESQTKEKSRAEGKSRTEEESQTEKKTQVEEKRQTEKESQDIVEKLPEEDQTQQENVPVPIISVRDVTMKFRIATGSTSGLKDFLIQKLKKQISTRELTALDHVSFEVFKGEVVGIIGTNGSGKSTLLKIVSGALYPSEGKVEVDRRKVQMLSLGAGFDTELSARENVYLNGAIIGYSKEFINRNYAKIVEFAELEGFMDEKVKNFSSGMVSRLAFAIATVGDAAEILILDEVLSVGDEFFKKKSLARVKEMIHGGSTVLMVSHGISTILTNCTKAVWIEKGRLQMVGNTEIVCAAYRNKNG